LTIKGDRKRSLTLTIERDKEKDHHPAALTLMIKGNRERETATQPPLSER
jgi:hypothetical protein